MAQIPHAKNLTLKELYAIFSQGRLQKTSLRELEEKGWLDIIKLGSILGLDSDGDIVWIPQDSTGRAPVVAKTAEYLPSYQTAVSTHVAGGAAANILNNTPQYGYVYVVVPAGATFVLTGAGGSVSLPAGFHNLGFCRGQLQGNAVGVDCLVVYTLVSQTSLTPS